VRDWLPLVILLISFLVIQLYLLRPPALSDQLDYFSAVSEFRNLRDSHRHLRIGLLFPVWGLIRIFGYSEVAYYAFPIASSAGLIAGTYWLGRLLFGTVVGLSAGALVVLNPYVLKRSGHLLPDIPGVALITIGLALIIFVAVRPNSDSCCKTFNTRELGYLVVAGLLFGWAYLIREIAAIAIVLTVVPFIAYKVPWRGMFFIMGGFGMGLLVELGWGWARFDEPFVRIVEASGSRSTDLPIIDDPLLIVGQLPEVLVAESGGLIWLVLGIVGFGGAMIFSLRRDERFYLLIAWTLGFWLLMTAAGLVPVFIEGEVLLRLQKVRYWFVLFPPLMVAALGTIWIILSKVGDATTFKKMNHPTVVQSTLLMLLLIWVPINVVATGENVRLAGGGASHYREFRSWLYMAGSDIAVMYVDSGHGRAQRRVLPMYTRNFYGRRIWEGELKSMNPDSIFLPPERLDGPIVRFERSVRHLQNSSNDLPNWLLDPPAGWTVRFESTNGSLRVIEPQP
jgi:hypothetical protein